PLRVITLPETRLATMRPPTIAIDINPAWGGDIPRAIWKYCERKTVDPNIATPTIVEAKTERLVVRSRKSRIGMIGSLARSSTSTATARVSSPTATRMHDTVEVQENSEPARETQTSRTDTPPAMSAA